MKSNAIYITVAALAVGLTSAAAVPDAAPSIEAVGQNDLGTIYTVSHPKERRDVDTWYPYGKNELGTVYSSIDRTGDVQKRDVYTPLSQEEVDAWIAKKQVLLCSVAVGRVLTILQRRSAFG